MSKGGRPTKLTPEVQAKLIQAITAGNYYEAACGYAGISYSAFRQWMRRGEEAKSGKYKKFVNAIKKAEREAEVRMVAQWQKHMPDNWQAIATFLERRHPNRWGRNRIDMNLNQKVEDSAEQDDGFLEALQGDASEVWDDEED